MIVRSIKKNRGRIGAIAGSMALAMLLTVAATGPAWADRGWDHHERDARHWHVAHPVAMPGYVYAPPVVYAPPPPSPGINLILPLNFR